MKRLTLEQAAKRVLSAYGHEPDSECDASCGTAPETMLARAVLEAAKLNARSTAESRKHKDATGRDLTGYHHGACDMYSAMRRAARKR